MSTLTVEEFGHLCALTVSLTKLRQAECKHLAVENYAQELLGKLIDQVINSNQFSPMPTRDIQVTPQESEQVSSRLCAD